MSNINIGHVVGIVGFDLNKKRDLEWQGYVMVSGSMAGFMMRRMFSPGHFVGDRP